MTGRAITQKRTFGRKIKDMDNDINRLYAMVTKLSTVEVIQAGGLNIGAGSPGDDFSDFMPRKGGSFTGAIAFEPKLLTIATAGDIDLNIEGDNFGSRIIVSPASGLTDNLVSIRNPAFNGQILFLQGVQGDTITMVTTENATAWATSTSYSIGDIVSNGGQVYCCYTAHTSGASTEPGVGASWTDNWYIGNIETIDGNDFDINDDSIILLQYDSTDAKWQQVTVAAEGGFKNPAEVDLDMAGFNITNIDELNSEDGNTIVSLSTGWVHNVPDSGDSHVFNKEGSAKFTIGNNLTPGVGVDWAGDLIPNTDGTHDLGESASPWNSAYFDNTVFANNLQDEDGGGEINIHADLDIQDGNRIDLTNSQTTVGSAGTASSLPTDPEGYIPIKVDGTTRVIPFYKAS